MPDMQDNSDSKIFVGVVITSNSGSYAVTIIRESYGGATTPDGGWMVQGVPVSSIMSSFLGFKDCTLPQPGSRVVCVASGEGTCYILGTIPQDSREVNSLPSRAMLGAKNALADDANRKGHEQYLKGLYDNRRPTDVVDGEYVVANELGVLLGLYQELANLKGSELAQIQCFLLDDLVRVISHNFQHYTALGEYNIYHDGKRIMAEFGATHKPAETYGRAAVDRDAGESVFEKTGSHTVDDKDDFYKITVDERLKAVERFKIFLGSVGDFLHMFLVRPDPDEDRFNDPAVDIKKPDTGLWDLHVGTDGGFHLRSVKEIFLEKTNWIRVPHRKAAPDDPKGDDAERLDYVEKDKFEFEDSFKYKENPFLYALQIRDYVAYVNEKLGYQNFKAHEKDFHVNDKIDDENKLSEIEKLDNETKLFLKDYKLRTAGIYLMPNGGITIRDAWNSAIVMEGGNVYIQPAKDLVSQPLRNNIVKAGQHINMTCKSHIDLSSSEEGLRVKTKKSQYLYSDAGGIVLESKGTRDTPGDPDPTAEAIDYIGGIVLKSKLGIYNYAEKDIVHYAKNQLLLQSLKNTDIIANTDITIHSKKSTYILTDDNLMVYAASKAYFVAGDSTILAGSNSTVLGEKDQNLQVAPTMGVIKGVVTTEDIITPMRKLKDSKEEILKNTTFKEAKKFEDLSFKFLASDKYGALDPAVDGLPATMAQQDDLLTELYKLEKWEEVEINETLPYPGKDLFENFYYSVNKPANLEKNKLGKDYSNKATSESKPAEIKLDSLQEYKVQK